MEEIEIESRERGEGELEKEARDLTKKGKARVRGICDRRSEDSNVVVGYGFVVGA